MVAVGVGERVLVAVIVLVEVVVAVPVAVPVEVRVMVDDDVDVVVSVAVPVAVCASLTRRTRVSAWSAFRGYGQARALLLLPSPRCAIHLTRGRRGSTSLRCRRQLSAECRRRSRCHSHGHRHGRSHGHRRASLQESCRCLLRTRRCLHAINRAREASCNAAAPEAHTHAMRMWKTRGGTARATVRRILKHGRNAQKVVV